jgi:anti-sigma factor RsiW
MTCERMAEILDAYVDAEVDPVYVRDIEWHLGECAQCARQFAARRALGEAIRTQLPRYRAPADLLPQAAVEKKAAPDRLRLWRNTARALAASLVIVVGGGTAWMLRPARTPARDVAIGQWVLNSHLRSLQLGETGRLVDVVSTDRHTVKPWFAGKLSFAPTVRDLTASGFPLVGGRLEMIEDQDAAALVYRRQKHVINLLMWPAEPGAGETSPTAQAAGNGFHEVHWRMQGMNYWAVSDVEEGELMAFARAFTGDGAASTAP